MTRYRPQNGLRAVRLVLTLALLLLTPAVAQAAPRSAPPPVPAAQSSGERRADDTTAAWVRAGLDSFDAGLRESDMGQTTNARARYSEAATAFERALESTTPTAGLHRNAATAYLLAGDTGRALLHLRRADRIDPTDPRTREALAFARGFTRTAITPGTSGRATEIVLWWRGLIDRRAMLVLGGLMYLAACVVAGYAVNRRSANAVLLTVALLFLVAVTAGMVLLEERVYRSGQDAVIISPEAMGHNGPSAEVFPTTFEQPLRSGIEARIIGEERGFANIRLRDGRETWVRRDALERI